MTIRRIIGCLLLGHMTACSSLSLEFEDNAQCLEIDNSNLANEWAPLPISEDDYRTAIDVIQRRAHQIAEVGWLPLGIIPSNQGSFPFGEYCYGIPYSSVKEMDKFVGQDVSFYTFLSAVQNPKSVLYSQNVGKEPYNGMNCSTYYGTVCSMAVNYVLGFNAPYESKMYPNLPFITRVEDQDPRVIRIGDILWQYGHVVLVEDIVHRNDNSIESVSILESSGVITKIRHYSFMDFSNRWKESSWVLYRYMDFGRIVDQESIPFLSSSASENYSFDFTESICVSRGDRAAFRLGEDVTVNILTSSLPIDIDIYKDEQHYLKLKDVTDDVVLTNLPVGRYTAISDGGRSSFEVIQTSVSIQHVDNRIKVSFSSINGIPVAFVLCNSIGNRFLCHSVSDLERSLGYVTISNSISDVFAKVYFQGEYGRVTNIPMYIH